MMEGQCPDEDWVDEMASRMNTRVTLAEIIVEGSRATRYVFAEAASRTRVALRCNDAGIEIVEAEGGGFGVPAAFR